MSYHNIDELYMNVLLINGFPPKQRGHDVSISIFSL